MPQDHDDHVIVLGSGPSAGVPMIGCSCEVCRSDNPKNRRSRVSVFIEIDGVRLLIDTSPDIREQCLRHDITKIDAILYTHAHADHLHGIDDVRSLNYYKDAAIPIYGDADTLEEIIIRFPYIFAEHNPKYGWYKPQLNAHVIEVNPEKSFKVADEVEVIAFPQAHGQSLSVGYRIGNFAYSTDVNSFPKESFQALENLDIWLVDCLSYDPMPTHAHLDLTLSWIEQLKPKQAILTHMGHQLDYETLQKSLPENVIPAYDGLVIPLNS